MLKKEVEKVVKNLINFLVLKKGILMKINMNATESDISKI